MAVWQYAQLMITLDALGPEDTLTILWHEPGQSTDENFSDSNQTVLELLNRFGADGWELTALQEQFKGGDGSSNWDAKWSLTTCTFKRRVL
jgi:hypothetical protein